MIALGYHLFRAAEAWLYRVYPQSTVFLPSKRAHPAPIRAHPTAGHYTSERCAPLRGREAMARFCPMPRKMHLCYCFARVRAGYILHLFLCFSSTLLCWLAPRHSKQKVFCTQECMNIALPVFFMKTQGGHMWGRVTNTFLPVLHNPT